MTYAVSLDNLKVAKFYKSADKALAKKLVRCFSVLEKTPQQHPNIKALTGRFKGKYRYRLGQYRVIYRIDEQMLEVVVLQISPRGSAYD